MIVQRFPSKKPVTSYSGYTPHHQQQRPQQQIGYVTDPRPNEKDKTRALQFKITPDEFVRRDKIVRELYLASCMEYKPGDIVRPKFEQQFHEYGQITIKGVFKSYHDFPTAEAMGWPKDDIPYIFTVQPEKGECNLLVVTAGFFAPLKDLNNAC